MKILFLSRRYYPDKGGIEKHIDEISKILVKQGHEITLITQSNGSTNKRLGIKLIRIPRVSANASEKLHIWKWFWKNKDLIKDADVIHAHDVYWWYWPYRFIFVNKKTFITFHGYETYPIKKGAIVSRKLSEFLANGNIIVGDFMKKWYFAKPTYVIYGGVEIPKKISKSKNELSAVFIGRLDEHTGILDYVKAVQLIREKYPEFKFEILGEGEYEAKLKKYNVIGFRRNIFNYLDDNNFAFASRYLSILEALASKRLVVAQYDNPVKEDYLRMAPFAKFIIIESSPEDIMREVKRFIKNKKESKKMIEMGFEWAKKQTWQNIASVYLSLWNK